GVARSQFLRNWDLARFDPKIQQVASHPVVSGKTAGPSRCFPSPWARRSPRKGLVRVSGSRTCLPPPSRHLFATTLFVTAPGGEFQGPRAGRSSQEKSS